MTMAAMMMITPTTSVILPSLPSHPETELLKLSVGRPCSCSGGKPNVSASLLISAVVSTETVAHVRNDPIASMMPPTIATIAPADGFDVWVSCCIPTVSPSGSLRAVFHPRGRDASLPGTSSAVVSG